MPSPVLQEKVNLNMPVVILDLRLILGVSGDEFCQQKIMIVLQKDFSLAFISFFAVCVLTTTVKQHFYVRDKFM